MKFNDDMIKLAEKLEADITTLNDDLLDEK